MDKFLNSIQKPYVFRYCNGLKKRNSLDTKWPYMVINVIKFDGFVKSFSW